MVYGLFILHDLSEKNKAALKSICLWIFTTSESINIFDTLQKMLLYRIVKVVLWVRLDQDFRDT